MKKQKQIKEEYDFIEKECEKKYNKYKERKNMKKRVKNSQSISNVKKVEDTGLIRLKNGEVATLLEIEAVDLSLASKQEKNNFFVALKSLYQIRGLNLKCYKLDQKINLNNNKINLNKKLENVVNNEIKSNLLMDNLGLIEDLEKNGYTISSVYYLVIISKTVEELEKVLDEIEEITSNIVPRININIIDNKLEIYKFLSNLYLTSNTLDELIMSDLPNLLCPMNVSEIANSIRFDDK